MKNLPLLFVLLFMSACREMKPQLIRNFNSGPALGTSYNITYLAEKELDYQTEIDSVFDAVNRSMSTYIKSSDIARINSGDTTVIVDQMFREVFELSKEVYRKTNGYFDPTVGILVNAWGFGPGEQMPLDSAKVDSLLRYVGFHKVSLNTDNQVHKEYPEIQFDFNAVAKGYAIDRLAVLLERKGLRDFLVEVGGEVVTKGENRIRKKPWVVGIENPQSNGERRFKAMIQLKNRALASSGNYRKFRIDPMTREKYVHTIDPKTGFTKNSRVLGANVIAGTCARADAYATAFMAWDLEESIQLLSGEEELQGYIIYLNDQGETSEFMTSGFRELIIE